MNTLVSKNQQKFLAENENKQKVIAYFRYVWMMNDDFDREWWFWEEDWLTQISINEKITATIDDELKQFYTGIILLASVEIYERKQS